MKGMRVQSIIRELRGEKIDIIEYSDDPAVFAQHALSPAKISRVNVLDPNGHHMEVVVDDSQLSLAIGKKGQNVRLAAKLLGWKIDIKSEEEKRREAQGANAAMQLAGTPISSLIELGLSEEIVDRLVGAGMGSVEKVGGMTPEELTAIVGITPEIVDHIAQTVNAYYGQEVPGSPGAESAPVEAPVEALVEAAVETSVETPVEAIEPQGESATIEDAEADSVGAKEE
jgi:transcription termination/antitermination protein NusA